MTSTEENVSIDCRELKAKRSSLKGRLTSFEKYLKDLKLVTTISKTQYNELKRRLKYLEGIFETYDSIQTAIEIRQEDPENQIDRAGVEDRFFMCIAESQEILDNYSPDTDIQSSCPDTVVQNSNFKLPQIKIPIFDGDITKWLEFHDTYSSMIHNNDSIASINKYQYLKSALTGTAASVIESLEISSGNYEVAWKLLCDRFNDKRKLVCIHLKALFDVANISKEHPLRYLANHIAKHLRALNNLGEKTDNWDTLIVFLFSAKLDSVSIMKWEEYKNSLSQVPTIEQFYTFLRNRADIIEATPSSSGQGSVQQQSQQQLQLPHYKRINKQQKSFVAATYENNKYNTKCLVCNGEHSIFYCKNFLSMSPASRFNLIIKYQHCLICFRSGHLAPQCRGKPCRICSGKHNTLLHRDKPIPEKEKVASSPISLSSCISNQILLSTAIVKVSCPNSINCIEARCLLDCGSQLSFITQDLKNKLCIENAEDVKSVCVTGINGISFNALQRCDIKVHSCSNAFNILVNAYIINKITSSLPSQEVDVSSIRLPKNIALADASYHIPAKIDILLGADIFWDILCNEQIKLGHNLPILQNSMFGWIISGPVMCLKSNIQTHFICNFSHEIQEQLNKFWELEEVPKKPVMSQEEEACEQHFMQHTRRLEDGRFCVSLPLKMKPETLGDSYYIARKRFISLERRFQRQPDIKSQYSEFIDEYEALGHLSVIARPENAVFLPHHPVLKEQSESTKCRVVFDASCKTTSGFSLNDIMMVGPTLQDDIFSILIRLRQHAYIFTADIEKMYRQILIEPSQRNLQMILWRKNEHEPISYLQLNTVTYGTSSAPYLSTRCLVQLALECNIPLIKEVILHDFYIDDLITGYCDEDGLHYIFKCINEQLRLAGFNLRKIKSNSQSLLNLILNESNSQCKQETLKISTLTNTLGIEWDPNSDCLLIPVAKSTKLFEKHTIFTKRTVLSVSSTIFDPLGLVCVCVITCKIILQQLWLQKLGWDDQIPDDISQMWFKFINNLKSIEQLAIPRQVISTNPTNIELHTFSDASLKAYAACMYVRSSDAVGNVSVHLLCAKSKVAPLKATTIPRLELCGAVLAARLCKKVTESLRCPINKQTFWCDSNVVLGWLNTPPHKLSAFVSHRVAEINELCVNNVWMYVPSSLNPADLASRGVYPEEVSSLSLWWEGPPYLKGAQEHWPDQSFKYTQVSLPEVRVHFSNTDTLQESVINFKKYSNFIKLRRILAYIFRFIYNCKQNVKKVGSFTVEELERSELKLAQLSQTESFAIYKNNFKNLPALYNLTPYVDEIGLIRVGGRLHNSEYNFDKKHPIVLDSKHYYTELVMKYFHVKLMHAGPLLLLSAVREQYWPIGGRTLARRICNNCLTCKRLKGAIATQIMGNLPAHRLSPGFPFEITGIDYAGPFLIINKKGRGARLMKCYLCIFICFKIKAVHLEIVSDLTTEAFILALRRFMSRRGKPREIFCDNGTNFVGASREIAALVKNCSGAVADLSNEGIKFNFSPVYSPHFGGLYEAAVKSAKYHFKRVIGNAHFTFEELTTLFCQIESILNSRPLTPLSSDPNDLTPLTPGHFLVGRSLTSLPSPDLQEVKTTSLHRFARIEQARQQLWSRWSRDYMCQLQQRTKWQKQWPNIKVNQLVLIKDESSPPLKWPLGRIIAVYPGSDGACRVADIQTSKGILRRAINKICPLMDTP